MSVSEPRLVRGFVFLIHKNVITSGFQHMYDYKQYLLESAKEGKNVHLDHVEDLMFLSGNQGLGKSITFLKSLRDMLSGDTKSPVQLSTKWDGAPALICGHNPDNGKFFVATKGAFANNPKLCYTPADVDRLYPDSPGLNAKLKIALKYITHIGIPQDTVLQGDMMFSGNDVQNETIHGEKYVTFRPNTITYAIPADSALAHRIKGAKVGIVFHTTYTGKPFSDMKASFNVDIGQLKNSKDVWYRDATFMDVSGTATFTDSETKEITNKINQIALLANQVNPGVMNKIASMETYRVPLMAWNNAKVREGTEIDNIPSHIQGFVKHMDEKLAKATLEAKKEDTKKKRIRERIEIMRFWKDSNTQKTLRAAFQAYNLIIEAKIMLVRKLENVQDVGTFLKSSDGYRVTKPEGFVATNHLSQSTIKLVDRLEFSRANFNAAKDWS